MTYLQVTQAHQIQSFQVPRAEQRKIAQYQSITLLNGNLPKGTKVAVSLNGGAEIQCTANGYSSITEVTGSPKSFKQWFRNRPIGHSISADVDPNGTLLISDVVPRPVPAITPRPAITPTSVTPMPAKTPSPATLSIMLIPPPYPNPVSLTCPHGVLAIPDLPWTATVPPLNLKKMGSFRGMYSIVCNNSFPGTLRHYLPHVSSSSQLVAGDINVLESNLMNDINGVLAGGAPYAKHPNLQHIAVGIHLWGGMTGRNAFAKGGGFAANCPMAVYANLIHLLMTQPAGVTIPGGNWPGIMHARAQLNNIGVSFLTKHLSFWSRAPSAPLRLPILDSIVKETFIDPNDPTPTWADYAPYVNQLNAVRAIIAARPGLAYITVADIERQLFNWANSPAAANWHR